MTILLYEPHAQTLKSIHQALTKQGYVVDAFSHIDHAFDAMDNGYSFYMIEMSYEPAKSLTLLKCIKDFYSSTPVMMLHLHKDIEIESLQKAYAYGCDDLIKKPFFADEVQIKCTKLLNVRDDVVALSSKCTFDFSTGLVRDETQKNHLSKNEKRLFSILFSQKERLVSFETIKSRVWEGESVSLDSIRSLVRRLRQKIPFHCIETIIDAGYILKLKTPKTTALRLHTKQSTHEALSA